MRGTTRRGALATCGTALTALAGCSAIPGVGDDGSGNEEYDQAALEQAVSEGETLTVPESFPTAVPPAAWTRHRDRARQCLRDVPADPDVPNGVVAEDLAEEHVNARTALDEDVSDRSLERLSTWRDRRVRAARVRGAYRAATGDLSRSTVATRRDEVRTALATFGREWRYRAADPVEATVAHTVLEGCIDRGRRDLVPSRTFPDDPVEAPFDAGELVGEIEGARAAVADAGRLRAAFLSEVADPRSYGPRLAKASETLDLSLSRTVDTVDGYVGAEPSALQSDVEGTPAGQLFENVTWRPESRREDARRASDAGRHATAVVETGRALVAAEALDAVLAAIRDGRYRERASVDDVSRARTRAVAALRSAWEPSPRPLAVALARPARRVFEHTPRNVRDGYVGLQRAFAALVTAEVLALAVPAATTFVEEHLRTSD